MGLVSALCLGVKRVRAPVMSHFQMLFIDRRYISVLVKCAVSQSVYLHENNYLYALRCSCCSVSYQGVGKKEMKRTIRDQRFHRLPVGQVLYYSIPNWFWLAGDNIFLWLTWESGFISGRERCCSKKYVCACRIACRLLKFPRNSNTLRCRHNLLSLHTVCMFPQRLAICLKSRSQEESETGQN